MAARSGSTYARSSLSENFAFLADDQKGGYIYHKLAPELYAVHTLSFPDGRGRELLEARSASLRAMFTQTDAAEIVTTVPDGNKGADLWASAPASAKTTGERRLST